MHHLSISLFSNPLSAIRSRSVMLRVAPLVIALMAITFGVVSDSAPASADTQTATFLGGFLDGATVGSLDSTTEYWDSASSTWKPAYLVGSHPWGQAPGTDSWINACPTDHDAACLNTTEQYRVRRNFQS